MNPTILGVIGPGFLNQVPTLVRTSVEKVPHPAQIKSRSLTSGRFSWRSMSVRLMDKILHDPKDPKLWELWYIPYYGSCRILSINHMGSCLHIHPHARTHSRIHCSIMGILHMRVQYITLQCITLHYTRSHQTTPHHLTLHTYTR